MVRKTAAERDVRARSRHALADALTCSRPGIVLDARGYASIDLNARVSAWALAGAGSGELTLKPENGEAMPADFTLKMGALGLRGEVLDGTGPSGLPLQIKSDALWVRSATERTPELIATQGDVTRLRLLLSGERPFAMEGGAALVPSAQAGLRHDAGDAERGVGVELGAGVRYTWDRLTVDAGVRALAAHEDGAYEERGASAGLAYAAEPFGAGLTLSLRAGLRF